MNHMFGIFYIINILLASSESLGIGITQLKSDSFASFGGFFLGGGCKRVRLSDLVLFYMCPVLRYIVASFCVVKLLVHHLKS